MTAVLAGAAGFLVNEFAPRALEQVEAGVPLQLVAGYDADRYDDGWKMATSSEIDPGTAPPPGSTCEHARQWLTTVGAAHVGESWLDMLVEGRRSSGVVIESMRARVLERAEPLGGSSIACPSAGAQENIAVGFELDSPNPTARILNDDGTLGAPYFSGNVVTVAKGETVSFSVVGKADASYVEWVIDLGIVVDGQSQTLSVGTEPFRTTAQADSYLSSWLWAWFEAPARLMPDEGT